MEVSGLIAARVVTYVTMMLAAGIPFYLTSARQYSAPEDDTSCRFAGLAALGGVAASAWWVLESVATMAAMPVGELDRAMILAVLDDTPLGGVLVVRVLALLAAAIAIWRRQIAVSALAASVALASMAWTGHAGATEGDMGAVHRAGDIIHLLAAAAWLGALFLFLTSAIDGGDKERLIRRLSGFAAIGSIIVLLLFLTGLANTLIIAGWPLDWGSDWSLLLVVKWVLFLSMLGLAACNRWRITPALARDPDGDLRVLQLSLALEASAGLGIVAIVGWLGTLTPLQ